MKYLALKTLLYMHGALTKRLSVLERTFMPYMKWTFVQIGRTLRARLSSTLPSVSAARNSFIESSDTPLLKPGN